MPGGLVLAFALMFATDGLFYALSTAPPPAADDADAMRTYPARQPVAALLAILAGWFGARSGARSGRPALF